MGSFTVPRKLGITVPSNGWTSAFHRIWKWRRHPWSTASSHLCLGSNIHQQHVFSDCRVVSSKECVCLVDGVYQNSSSTIPINPVWKEWINVLANFSMAWSAQLLWWQVLRITPVPCSVWNSRMVMSDTFLHHLQHPASGPKSSNSRRSAFGARQNLQRSKRTKKAEHIT